MSNIRIEFRNERIEFRNERIGFRTQTITSTSIGFNVTMAMRVLVSCVDGERERADDPNKRRKLATEQS